MVSKESNLIFLTPPKTASNSLRSSLELSKIKFDKFDPWYHKPNTHLYLSELVENFKIENVSEYKIIQIYRNPFEKFVSAFYHLIKLVPNTFKITKMGLNEFVKHYSECFKSESYIECMYDDPSYVRDLVSRKINFGGTRYFVEQYKWNDLGLDVKYIDISNINSLSQEIGIDLPKIGVANKFSGEKESLNSNSIDIISELYKRDFSLLK